LLFDGEQALKSKASQDRVYQKFGIQVKAHPGYKRQSAERFVKEYKLRTLLALEEEGGSQNI
jgi:hypothetical protein